MYATDKIAHDRFHSSMSSDLLAVSTHQTTKVICLRTSSHSSPLRTALYIASAIPGNFPPDSFAPALAYTTCRVDMRELIPATRKFRSKFWSLSLMGAKFHFGSVRSDVFEVLVEGFAFSS